LGTRVIWAFKEIFNGNLTMMALKGKKLHPDDIQRIRDFMMAYKGSSDICNKL
jgi:ABC-type phosphate/phosphonate transport system substrate-binding protein